MAPFKTEPRLVLDVYPIGEILETQFLIKQAPG